MVASDGLAVVTARGCTPPAKSSWALHQPFMISDAAVYQATCTVARVLGPRQIAREYGVRSPDLRTICQKYAAISYQRALIRPAVNGCLKGFSLRPT
jgi:hypothetical protein